MSKNIYDQILNKKVFIKKNDSMIPVKLMEIKENYAIVKHDNNKIEKVPVAGIDISDALN